MMPINLFAANVPRQRKELLFWLALVLSFRLNFAMSITQNYQVESLDDTRNALMSFASGSSKPGGATGSKPSRPSNSFLTTVDQIEKSVYDAQAMKWYYSQSTTRAKKIKDYIKLASKRGNTRFIQQLLGHGLYTSIEIEKRKATTPSRTRRCTPCADAVKKYLDTIKKEVKSDVFDKLLAVVDKVTLMFAIDDTGSMHTEIVAAKAIAEYIIKNQSRQHTKLDYVLSPFNDPTTGPLTIMDVGKGNEFSSKIKNLKPHGGGDCPELAFTGMHDALTTGFAQEKSPLYVFTDATAKDSYKYDLVKVAANTLRSSVYFFTTGLCGKSKYGPYDDLAQATCGQVFELPKYSSDLAKMKKVTKVLLGAAPVHCDTTRSISPFGRKKRSFSIHKIPLDDSMNKVIVSVTTQNRRPSIVLRDPVGVPVSKGRTTYVTRGAIFVVDHPKPGVWKLSVSPGAGKHSYVVKASGTGNLDFDFIFVNPRGRMPPLPIPHPLIGHSAHVILIVRAADKIRATSLKLEILSRDKKLLNVSSIHSVGKSGAHFSASFSTPSVPFTLKLKGKTKKNFDFERDSPNIVQPGHALLRVLYARREFTVPIGGKGLVVFFVYNTAPTESFHFQVKTSRVFDSSVSRSRVRVYQNRIGFFYAWFTAKSGVIAGTGDDVMVTATGMTSKAIVSSIVSLMAY